jgi:glycosyltransferase involved in cell wall biosynthesis
MSEAPVRLLSIVSSLCVGGAEKHAIALLNDLNSQEFWLSLVYLKPEESLLPQLNQERLHSIESLNVASRLDWKAVKRLAHHIEAQEIDIILCTNEYPALYAFLAARLVPRRPKLVEVFHTTLLRTLKERIQFRLYRYIFRCFDLLIYVSQNQREFWAARGLGAKRDVVIHNGVDVDHFADSYTPEQKLGARVRFGFGEDDYVVAICAALRPEKAHGDYLQALAKLRARGLPVKGLIIGDGSERRSIERRIEALNLADSVFITGFQSDIRPLVACSDVVVLTSTSTETFSVAALEAMALGKPLVLSNIGGADEQVSDNVNGFLFEPGDIDALTAHLAYLNDANERARMGQASLRRVRQSFTQSGMLAAFTEQLAALCRRPSLNDCSIEPA